MVALEKQAFARIAPHGTDTGPALGARPRTDGIAKISHALRIQRSFEAAESIAFIRFNGTRYEEARLNLSAGTENCREFRRVATNFGVRRFSVDCAEVLQNASQFGRILCNKAGLEFFSV